MTPRSLLSLGKRSWTPSNCLAIPCRRCSRSLSTILLKQNSHRFRKPLVAHNTRIHFASTDRPTASDARSLVTRLKNLLLGTAISLTLLLGYAYITDTRASLHLLTPSVLKWVYEDAEDAHEAGNRWLKALYRWGLHPRERGKGDAAGDLSIEVYLLCLLIPNRGLRLRFCTQGIWSYAQ